MAYVKNNWVDREGITRYFETVDSDGAKIFTPDYTQVTEIGTPVNADNMNHIEDGIVDHENRITVLEEGGDASNFLNKSQITNCLLEVPQNIKLELNNGTLTLKAGSVVTVPNGFEADGTTPKFDYVTVKSDVVAGNPYTNDDLFIYYYKNSNSISQANNSAQCSGASSSISNGYWYDTTNNSVKRVSNGAEAHTGESLPLGIIKALNGSWSSINQVFNGMGYIGSTVWVDKGVKGLIPNGRNEDGTLNNIEFVTSKVLTRTYNGTDIHYAYVSEQGIGNQSKDIYNVQKNINDNAGSQFKNCLIVTFNTSSGVISNFQPKQTFHAVDYNEAVLKSYLVDIEEAGNAITSLCMPDYSRATTWNTGGGIVPYDCLLAFYVTTPTNMNTGSGGMTVYIDGVCVYATRANEYEATTGSFLGYAPKGANVVVTTKNNGTANYAYIIPLKGVN